MQPCQNEKTIDIINQKIDALEIKTDKRLDKIELKLDDALSFKMKLIGGISVVMFLVTSIISLIKG
jgi:hypothetical protein